MFRQAMADTLSGPATATELVMTGGGSGSDSGGSSTTVTLQGSTVVGRRLQEAGSRLQRQPARRLSAAPAAQVQLLSHIFRRSDHT